ncbi:hypothetical protein ZOD2009_14966 [Haladaptatus paucihalophilus DX253]|uniref:Uncharacterized protein n=1 Tax=Haladaptatus paucihalophilus DX253 TaxID=797209 RepID=E7QW05_HALPU|nr:hypothetical protein [Haladaptatus paucihalophilus]EFW91418.1 hypothetical protein ZOD2009_14966 [Haladaptatus paucihalophilus DX253]SHL00436.1 hypothetical protein SAMN05444342_2709 [Haladaptatus paucihalophilus DX253]
MVGNTLHDIRRHVESLATDGGTYRIVCGRTGTSPVPIAGQRFESRDTAQTALRFAEQYRAALRRYDPHLPYHDLIVCETPRGSDAARDATPPFQRPTLQRSARSVGGDSVTDHQPLIDFCHDVTGALFETLATEGFAAVERAVMDVYLDAAESISDRDEFCLILLESMVEELTDRLSADEQARVLASAAARLPPTVDDGATIETVLEYLVSVSIVSDYRLTSMDDAVSPRAWLVRLSEYALQGDERYLPTLPLAIELRRIYPESVSIEWARSVDADDWELCLSVRSPTESDGTGLLRAAVRDS